MKIIEVTCTDGTLKIIDACFIMAISENSTGCLLEMKMLKQNGVPYSMGVKDTKEEIINKINSAKLK